MPPGIHCAQMGNTAINTKINSPANILPKSRNAKEKGFTNSSINRNAMFNGNSQGPKGATSTSFPNFQPFTVKL